jgi:BlaI family penicillinase repressor
MKTDKPLLTDQELEIMKIVWVRGTATVRDVYEELLKHRKIAYTTVMTMMGILEQKGHLKKSADERAYLYTPAQPQREVVGNMVHDFLKRVFNGSAKPLLIQLVEDKKLSPEELDEIRKLLKDKRRKK